MNAVNVKNKTQKIDKTAGATHLFILPGTVSGGGGKGEDRYGWRGVHRDCEEMDTIPETMHLFNLTADSEREEEGRRE